MIIGADVLLKADLKVSMKYIVAVRIEMICRSANSDLSCQMIQEKLITAEIISVGPSGNLCSGMDVRGCRSRCDPDFLKLLKNRGCVQAPVF